MRYFWLVDGYWFNGYRCQTGLGFSVKSGMNETLRAWEEALEGIVKRISTVLGKQNLHPVRRNGTAMRPPRYLSNLFFLARLEMEVLHEWDVREAVRGIRRHRFDDGQFESFGTYGE